MSHNSQYISRVCEKYNPYFKSGCDKRRCLNQHLSETVYIKYCTKINQDNPPSAEAREAFATALNDFKHHRDKSAIAILNNLIADYPVNSSYRETIARFYERSRNERNKARMHFQAAIAIRPYRHMVHTNYANYCAKVNDNKTASIHFNIALKLNDQDAVVHGMYGRFLRVVEKDYESSQYHYKWSLDLNPNDTRSLYQYGLLLHEMKQLQLSKYYFEKCLRLDIQRKQKPFVWRHYRYALLLKDLNDYKKAQMEFEYCLSLKYNDFNQNSDIHYEYGLLLCENKQIEKGLHFLYIAYRELPQNLKYETAFNQYKDIHDDHDDGSKYSSKSTSLGTSSSSYSSTTKNHLEIRKTRKEPPPNEPPFLYKENKENESGNKYNVHCKPPYEIEFERWLRNKGMGSLYCKFEKLEYNDIRLLEYFGINELTLVGISELHIKIFQKQIEMFKSNMRKFAEWLKIIGVYNEYYEKMESKGILTFESFYHYMNSPYDIELVIGKKNKVDAVYIWSSTPKYSRRIGESQTENEGQSIIISKYIQ